MSELSSRAAGTTGIARKSNPFKGSKAETFRFCALVAFLTLCLMGGGGARADILSLIYVRAAAVLFVALLVLSPGHWHFRSVGAPLVLLGVFALTVALQLVPLPPAVWISLPGHARFAAAADLAGIAQPWRPLTLSPEATLNTLISVTIPAAFLLGLAALRRDQRQAVLWLMLVGACGSALLGLLQLVSPETPYLYDITNLGAPVGLLANRNHQANLLAIAIPMIALALRLWPPHSRWRAGAAIAVVASSVLLLATLATGSRAGIGLMVMGIVGAFWLAPRYGATKSPKARGLVLAVWALPIVAAGAAIAAGRALSIERLSTLSSEGLGARLENVPVELQIVRDFMPFGTGYGSFDPLFRVYEPDWALGPTYFNHAHNDLLELILTGGAPAAFTLMLFLGWFGVSSVKLIRVRASQADLDQWLGRLGILIIAMLLGGSLFDYPLRTPLIAIYFATACAWVSAAVAPTPQEAASGRARSRRRRQPFIRPHAMALVGLGTLALGWACVGVTLSSVLGSSLPDLVLSIWPASPSAHAARSSQMLAAGPLSPARIEQAATEARGALQQDPLNVEAARNLGVLHGIWGDNLGAEHLITYAESLSRRDLPTQLWLIESNVRRNNIPAVLQHYSRALAVSPEAGGLLFPILSDAATFPYVRRPLVQLLLSRPEWWLDFDNYAINHAASPATVYDLARLTHLSVRNGGERDAISNALSRLAGMNRFDLAFGLYRAVVGPSALATLVRNGDFESDGHLQPFDWVLANGNGRAAAIQTRLEGGGRALFLQVQSGLSGEVARQLLTLPPGEYTVSLESGDIRRDEGERPQLAVLCAQGATQLLDMRLPPSPPAGTNSARNFPVPAGCQAQWLIVSASGPTAGSSNDPWIDRVSIRRLR